MKVLVDIVHPAHVHFYRYLIRELDSRGHGVLVASRHKDVTIELLDAFDIPHVPISAVGPATRLAQGRELATRDYRLWQLARKFGPDVILTRNPCGVQVARLVGAIGVFDTDDGRDVGIHWRMAAPFAHVITTPEAIEGDLGPKHRTYRSYKAMAYLDPRYRSPLDPPVTDLLGLDPDEGLTVLRLVSMQASHDHTEEGLSPTGVRRLVERLTVHGRLVVSCEGPVPASLEPHRFDLPPARLHDVLSAADLVVGDSQSVATEAAILGTPTIHVSSFSGRHQTIVELEERYGLLRSFPPDRIDDVINATDRLLQPNYRAEHRGKQEAMLLDQQDLVAWYLHLLDELHSRVN